MKFKKGDRVECIKEYPYQFTKGKIYIVREDGLSERGCLLVEEDDRGKTNGHYPKYFKLIEENKMKTDNETMIEVLQKVISNIEHGIEPTNGIQVHINEWEDKDYIDFQPNEFLYRIKPETITLRNGVTIPKPVERNMIDRQKRYFCPFNDYSFYCNDYGFSILDRGVLYAYESKEQAIEASKKLFGIE